MTKNSEDEGKRQARIDYSSVPAKERDEHPSSQHKKGYNKEFKEMHKKAGDGGNAVPPYLFKKYRAMKEHQHPYWNKKD